MSKAYSVKQVLQAKFKTLNFTEKWFDLVGKPEAVGAWLVWGNSYNGKSSFALSLSKYLTNFGRVAYNSLEEGHCESLRQSYIRSEMEDVNGKLLLLDQESTSELTARLKRPKSPRFIFIDSLQYACITSAEYKLLISSFRSKLFIFLSHADGKHPSGTLAKQVRYDAFVKIWIEGFMAFAQSRYGGNSEPFTIWKKGADKYWGEITTTNKL